MAFNDSHPRHDVIIHDKDGNAISTMDDEGIRRLEISGKVTIEEEKEWTKRIEDALKTNEKLNVLVVLNEKASWGIHAGIADIKWIMTHMKSIHKIAFVSSSTVWKWLVSIDSFFASMVGIEENILTMLV